MWPDDSKLGHRRMAHDHNLGFQIHFSTQNAGRRVRRLQRGVGRVLRPLRRLSIVLWRLLRLAWAEKLPKECDVIRLKVLTNHNVQKLLLTLRRRVLRV